MKTNLKLKLITDDVSLTQKFLSLFSETEVFGLDKPWEFIIDTPEDVYCVDNRKEMARFNPYGITLGIVENYEKELLATHLQTGYLDILPISALNGNHAIDHIVNTANPRMNALNSLALPEKALNICPEFALKLLMAEESYPEVGKALMDAINPLDADAADFYLLQGQDLNLLAELGNADTLVRKPRISLDSPSPFLLPYNYNQPVWFNVAGVPQEDFQLPQEYIGIFPCHLDGISYGFLRLYFNGDFRITSCIKAEIKRLMRLTARALHKVKKSRNTDSQKNFAYRLLGMASHDLRNPLSTLQLSAQFLLAADEQDATKIKTYQRVANAVKNADSIINSLLDFSRIHFNEELSLNLQPITLDNILNNVLDELTIQAPHRKIEVFLSGNLKGLWDGDRLRQVFANLLGNAHKYSPPGETVTVNVESRNENIFIQIKNRQPIIPKENLHTLFDPMFRAKQSQQSGIDGLGIGLYVVKCLVELHGGSVWAESHPATGTVFTIELPIDSTFNAKETVLRGSEGALRGKAALDLNKPVQFPLGMEDICCKTFFRLWTNLSLNGLPHTRSLPEEELSNFTPDICRVSVHEKDDRFFYCFTQVGKALEHRLGRNVTGLQFSSLDAQDDLAEFIASYHRACTSKAPDFLYANFRLDNSELHRLEKLVLPFSNSMDGRVTDLISIVRFSGIHP